MRILHTSDWHLGRIFHGIHLTEDQAHILAQFVSYVKEEKPDVILISGDVFDRSVPPTEAVNLLDEVITQILLDHRIPIIMVAGNHDSPERLGFGYRLLQGQGLHIVGRLEGEIQPIIIHDIHGPVHFYPIPYAEPAMVRDRLRDEGIHNHDESMGKLMDHVRRKLDNRCRNVLVAHAFVAGGVESESERPLSVGGSSVVNTSHFQDFHYVALGHLHRPQRVGQDHIRYSGSLMKYSFSEANHQKNLSMIEIDGTGGIRIEYAALSPKKDLRCIEGNLEDILRGPQGGESKEDYLMVTLKDEGALLDPMGKLRKVYPNVLHIERPQFMGTKNLCGADTNYRKMSEMDLFSSFLYQMTEKEITEEQKKAFEEVMNQYYRRMREGSL